MLPSPVSLAIGVFASEVVADAACGREGLAEEPSPDLVLRPGIGRGRAEIARGCAEDGGGQEKMQSKKASHKQKGDSGSAGDFGFGGEGPQKKSGGRG